MDLSGNLYGATWYSGAGGGRFVRGLVAARCSNWHPAAGKR